MIIFKYWLEFVTGLCLAIVVVATFLQVVTRFVIKIPMPWAQEVALIGFAYMVFLGAALGVKHSMHLSVDVLGNLSPKARLPIISIGYLLSIIFVIIFIYYGWVHSLNSKLQFTSTLEISTMYIYFVLPVSGLIMLYYLVRNWIREISSEREGGRVT